jgi:hypothetical protein
MTIEFLCPEGHKIRCPAEKAGRPAKCPKCGVGFRIPTLDELGVTESPADGPALTPEISQEPAAPSSPGGSGKRPAAKEQQIEFLCPNGHHLHGPASLQGKAGECPECGSRFRIPIIDEPEPETLTEPELQDGLGELADDEIILESSPRLVEPEEVQSEEPLEFLQVLEDSRSGRTPSLGASGGLGGSKSGQRSAKPALHPLAALFIEMWAARDEGSRVEVHLESGSVILPDGYVNSHSRHDYAVFVTKDPDGCSTVTLLPWSSISRIIMRALKQVPGEVVR